MKGRKTHEAKSQFVLTLLLIGREEGANFLVKLQSVLKQSSRITFATHLTLISYLTIQLSFKKYFTSGTTAFNP